MGQGFDVSPAIALRFARGFAAAVAFGLVQMPSAVAAGNSTRAASKCEPGPRGELRCPRYSAPHSDLLPGGETSTARDRRLRRECRGARDAGVCKGYGSWY